MWSHQSLIDFWGVGRGHSKSWTAQDITKGDMAWTSFYNADPIYKLFGKNTELLIYHA